MGIAPFEESLALNGRATRVQYRLPRCRRPQVHIRVVHPSPFTLITACGKTLLIGLPSHPAYSNPTLQIPLIFSWRHTLYCHSQGESAKSRGCVLAWRIVTRCLCRLKCVGAAEPLVFRTVSLNLHWLTRWMVNRKYQSSDITSSRLKIVPGCPFYTLRSISCIA